MPDTRTVGEQLADEEQGAIERVGGSCVWETKSQYGDAWAQMLGWLKSFGILDALIGAQGRVVYTEEDVEAVRAALAPFIYGKEFADLEFLDSDSVGENKLLPMARAAITAAGGVVADEVVPVKSGTQVMFPKPPGRCTLYIVRAKEE